MIKKIITAVCAGIMITNALSVTAIAQQDDRTIVYVATDGNDSNDGSKQKPFASIKRARNEIRELRKNGQIGKKGAVIYLREGIYQQHETVDLNQEDSGEENAPLVIRSYPGEKATLIGGIYIDLKNVKKTTDSSVLDKVIDQKAKNYIYEVNLYDLGFTDIPPVFYTETYGFTTLKAYGFDDTYGNKILDKLGMTNITTNAFELFVSTTYGEENKVLNNARYPDEGYMTVKNIIETSTHFDNHNLRVQEYYESMDSADFDYASKFIPDDEAKAKLWATRDLSDVYIWWRPQYDWADEGNRIQSIDDKNGQITTSIPTWYGLKEGQPLYIYNFFDEISDGEFYIDYDTGMLYMCMEDGANLSQIIMSTMEQPMFSINNGAEYITIRDLEMKMTRDYCVYMKDAYKCLVDNVDISYTSHKQCVFMDVGCTECGITNSYLHDVNGGININTGGDDKVTLTKRNCYAINNEIENYARLNKTYNAALSIEGCGQRAAYNKIHGGDHLAISGGGPYQLFEYNEIYDACVDVNDMGALYFGQSWQNQDYTIQYNYFHDIGRNGADSHGIYLDDGCGGANVIGNVCENVTNYGIFLGGGRYNTVINNIVVNSNGGIFMDQRYEGKESGEITPVKNWNSKWSNNEKWAEAFPETQTYFDNTELLGTPINNIISNNLLYNNNIDMNLYPKVREYSTIENNLTTKQDPGFMDLENGDYTLKEDSEVFTEIPGFKPVPFTRMGMVNDRAMDRIIGSVVIMIDSPNAFVGGKVVSIDESEEVTPIIINDLTYLPLRFLAESIGYNVEYDESTQEAVVTNDTNELKINIKTGEILVNGQSEQPVEPVIVEGRTLLPLRAISELLSKQVFWDDKGFISVSDYEDLFNSKTDAEMIDYLMSELTIY